MNENPHDRLLTGEQLAARHTASAREQLPQSQQAQPQGWSGGERGPLGSVGVPGPSGPPLPRTPDDPVYDFEHLGLKIAESLVLAAEAQVTEANNLLEQTKAVADSIREQVKILTDSLTGFNGRLKTFGGELLDAHRKFNGDKH